jgi:hypothetical protein
MLQPFLAFLTSDILCKFIELWVLLYSPIYYHKHFLLYHTLITEKHLIVDTLQAAKSPILNLKYTG